MRLSPSLPAIAAAIACFLLPVLPVQAADLSSEPVACAVQTSADGTLARARSLFFSQCDHYPLTDCDPVAGGGWECSSEVIGSYSPGGPAPASSQPVTTPATASAATSVVQPVSGTTQVNGAGNCYVRSGTLDSAKSAFARDCNSYKRQDCDPIAGQWICSSANITSSTLFVDNDSAPVTTQASVQSTPTGVSTAPISNAQPVTAAPPSPPPAQAVPVQAPLQAPLQPSVANASSVGRLGTADLLALHYDNCPDRDDGHAIAAGKSVVETLGINNVMVVNGTCGNTIRDRFVQASFAVVTAAWGDGYLDAANQREASVSRATDRWASVLSNGGNVWVAEGGQSDFTADIVRRMAGQYPNVSLQRIHIVQHSAGSTAYNEKFTDSANLAYLKSNTSYQAIANGNVGGNGTADLNTQSSYFVGIARAGRFSSEWNAAFAYLPPDCAVRTENCKLDFSDTVELLYIVDDRRIDTVDDFASNYLK
jgi:hypothetical protein